MFFSRRLPSSICFKRYLKGSSSFDDAKESSVPSGVITRVATYGSLIGKIGAKSLYGNFFPSKNKSLKFSPHIMTDVVTSMCKLRGAALKLGQMLSVQDETIFPKEIQDIFERVRQSADYMPFSQVNKVMSQELGPDWKDKFNSFETRPFSAASIGQVHMAVLHDGTNVAVKVQYPGISKSIIFDLKSLKILLDTTNIFPKGLFMSNTLSVAERELLWEVDYLREANCQKRFINLITDHLNDEFHVPKVFNELTTKRVLTTEFAPGISLDKLNKNETDLINRVCLSLLKLSQYELFKFNFMQTDANWSNFLYNENTGKISLIDFGASREFSKEFVDNYIVVIKGAAEADRDKVYEYSKRLGFLTGYEKKIMVDAHIDAVMILGLPFRKNEVFDFSDQKITKTIGQIVPTMLKHRLTPPPEDTYSLHRKMSGIFLLCAKLGASVNCKYIFDDIWNSYK